MKARFIFLVACLVVATSPSAIRAQEKFTDFSGVLQCRSIKDNTQRISCYDKTIAPTQTQTTKKFESREQCPDEKDIERRLTCYDSFFLPTFKVEDVSKPPAPKEVTTSKADIAECRTEVNGTKRLACYDKLFPIGSSDEGEESANKPAINTGKWFTHTTTSPVDDSKNVVLMLESNDTIRTAFGETVTPAIFVTCREKKTELYVNWDVYLGLNETSMLYRLDKQKAVERTWTISTDTKATFYSGKVIDFVKSISKADKLFARITPYNESPVSVTFDVAGLSDALQPLKQACGWK
ncbi:type VI secretion system-associated protein TagO [Pantoea coffeiphila]|uniref:type VI secretion system-associated protein TagO n=1 Tax=Pantoea coffeiphila TaxID=1465635 RepID=UPI0019620FCD|nr:type VI secretion system-associated protein TagO [Pantoea coffeiphila]MBM7341695.1 type VI secretion system protein VasI [Pantoea coffeiphila]